MHPPQSTINRTLREACAERPERARYMVQRLTIPLAVGISKVSNKI